ncbi:MAG: hypothetical protein V1888_01580 [archaeon]
MVKLVRFSAVLFLGIMCFSFALAVILVSDESIIFSSVNESGVALYNFSVNNTQDAENISEINVTLPNGFVFVVDSNATDVAATTFSNTSTVLTWVNSSAAPLVENGSLQYFWFNVTASAVAADYNFTITVSNTTGIFETQNLSVTVNDTGAPVITLIAPADSTSATTAAYNFTFNVTDDQTVSNCSLILDDAVINTLTSVNGTGGTNGMYNSSLSVATHTWSVNCTDSTGNEGNSSSRTLIVSAAAVAEVATTSSGGSGTPTYSPSAIKLSEGYDISLGERYKVNLDLMGARHVLVVDDISDNGATITVSSTPVTLDLVVEQMEMIDVDDDGVYDLSIYLKEISYSRANFILTSISEEATGLVPSVGDERVADSSKPVSGESVEVMSSSGSYIWMVVIVILLIVGIVFGLNYKKKK